MELNDQLVKDIVQWDIKNWSKALRYWNDNVKVHSGIKALELGSREGGLSLWLALNGATAICSDIGDVEKTASVLHKKYGVTDKITYETIDALNIPYENEFDIIVFKSIVGGIGYGGSYERQQLAIQQMHKALKPGGKLLFAENLTGSKLHLFMRRKFVKWGDSWRYITISETEELLKDFKSCELKTTGFLAAFGRSEKQRSFLGPVDNLLSPVTPKGWKYIVYGIAEK